MIDLDEIERRANAATPGPWYVHDRPADFWTVGTDPDWPFECEVFDDGSARGEYDALCSIADRDFLVAARTDVPALIARVRELEAESAKWKEAFERIRSTNTDLMMQLFEAQEKVRAVNIEPVLHENARLRVALTTKGWADPGANIIMAGDLIGLRRKDEP
jgi:hypothetical protein